MNQKYVDSNLKTKILESDTDSLACGAPSVSATFRYAHDTTHVSHIIDAYKTTP